VDDDPVDVAAAVQFAQQDQQVVADRARQAAVRHLERLLGELVGVERQPREALLLRAGREERLVELLALGPAESPSDSIIGRVCICISEL